jgi:hypothetical protein
MSKKVVLLFLGLHCIINFAMPQNNPEREDIYLARVGLRVQEIELQDALSLWFTDADTGQPIQGALVAIENTGSTRTDEDGLGVFPIIADGEYAFIFQKDGYVTTKDVFFIYMGSIFSNKYSIPKIMQIDNIKIIVDWGRSPADLDAHLVKENEYHISYRNARISSDNATWLDRDAMNGYGPETITITQLDRNAVYRYFVHNYSNRNSVNDTRLSQSNTTVRIFINNRFYRSYQIETGRIGTTWHVFEIRNGEIVLINRFE